MKENIRQLALIMLLTFTTLINFAQNPCPDREVWKNKIDAGDKKCIDDWTRIATFEARKCQCERGWGLIDGHKVTAPESELKEMEAHLEVLKYQIQHEHMYSSCVAGYTPNYSPCKRNGGDMTMAQYKSGDFPKKNASNKLPLDPNSGIIVKDEYLGLLKKLAGDSKNPEFINMVETMNKNHESVSKAKDIMTAFGVADQNDIEFYNMTENIGQAVAIGKFLYETFKKEKPKPLTEGQKLIINHVGSISKNLRVLFNEISASPSYSNYNENTLNELIKKEDMIKKYDVLTAKPRLLFWKAQSYNGHRPYQNEFKIISDKLNQDETTYSSAYLLNQIDMVAPQFGNAADFPHMSNNNIRFEVTLNEIAFAKVKCYQTMSDEEKANEILINFDYEKAYISAFQAQELGWEIEQDYLDRMIVKSGVSEKELNKKAKIGLKNNSKGAKVKSEMVGIYNSMLLGERDEKGISNYKKLSFEEMESILPNNKDLQLFSSSHIPGYRNRIFSQFYMPFNNQGQKHGYCYVTLSYILVGVLHFKNDTLISQFSNLIYTKSKFTFYSQGNVNRSYTFSKNKENTSNIDLSHVKSIIDPMRKKNKLQGVHVRVGSLIQTIDYNNSVLKKEQFNENGIQIINRFQY